MCWPDPEGLALPRDAVLAALPGGGEPGEQILFHCAGAAHPAPPRALWFLRQMRRWGWLDDGVDLLAVAASVYRPDLYSVAAQMEDLFVNPGSLRNNANFEARVGTSGHDVKLPSFKKRPFIMHMAPIHLYSP